MLIPLSHDSGSLLRAQERGKMDEYGFILDEAETDEHLHAGCAFCVQLLIHLLICLLSETYSAKRRECWRSMLAKWDEVPAYKARQRAHISRH